MFFAGFFFRKLQSDFSLLAWNNMYIVVCLVAKIKLHIPQKCWFHVQPMWLFPSLIHENLSGGCGEWVNAARRQQHLWSFSMLKQLLFFCFLQHRGSSWILIGSSSLYLGATQPVGSYTLLHGPSLRSNLQVMPPTNSVVQWLSVAMRLVGCEFDTLPLSILS